MKILKAVVKMPDDCYIVKTSDYFCRDKAGRAVYTHRSKKHPYLLVWDSLHGEIEVFDKKTYTHAAIYHPNGDFKAGPIKGRKLKL